MHFNFGCKYKKKIWTKQAFLSKSILFTQYSDKSRALFVQIYTFYPTFGRKRQILRGRVSDIWSLMEDGSDTKVPVNFVSHPDNNQVLKKGTLKDVKVKMGKSKETATTSISTGDATLVDP